MISIKMDQNKDGAGGDITIVGFAVIPLYSTIYYTLIH